MFTVLSVKIEMKKILNKNKNNLPAQVTFLRPTDKESDNYSEFLSLCHKLSTLSESEEMKIGTNVNTNFAADDHENFIKYQGTVPIP